MLVALAIRAADVGADDRVALLQNVSLDDLLVTTASRKPEKRFDTAASVSVLTGEEIERSGARSLGDALRLVPGVQVAQLDGSFSAISARGFSDGYANKLLVLVDGRAVYTPAFGGVTWEDQGVPLGEIDRIEVIRGPGGTLWGANAVNGVINIITKDAKDSQGWLINSGGGSLDRGFGSVRYGTKVGENGYLRLYVKSDDQGPFDTASGLPGQDGWLTARTGLRYDLHSGDNHVTLQGDYYYGQFGHVYLDPSFSAPFTVTNATDRIGVGGNAMFRWTHSFSDGTDWQLQAYYDNTTGRNPIFHYTLDTYDLDFQHRIRLPWRQELVYGAGYRLLSDHSSNLDPNLLFLPPMRNQQLASAFAQDEITLVQDRLRFILGSKFEHNDYTGFEIQPNARLVWTPTAAQTLWGAVSRAIRSPSRTERDIILNLLPVSTTPLIVPRGYGSSDFGSEALLAYELGYRIRPVDNVSLDWSGYYFNYDRLGTAGFGTPFLEVTPGVPHVVAPLFGLNAGYGRTYGFEASADVEVQAGWHLRGGYSLLQEDLVGNTFAGGGKDPMQQAFLRSSMDFPKDVRLDVTVRYVDAIRSLQVPGYVEADVRVAWRPINHLELAIVGQNLLAPRHAEFGQEGSVPTLITDVPRMVYGQVTLRF
ncbi:MAG: TonB-dependent receptor plug domain-containing protein [Limisphaerales bacterium]